MILIKILGARFCFFVVSLIVEGFYSFSFFHRVETFFTFSPRALWEAEMKVTQHSIFRRAFNPETPLIAGKILPLEHSSLLQMHFIVNLSSER